ncbi:MAG: SsrA-binding protein SmpB [Bdellovibrionaceae bacterium]|nr:SsrA-binding protein SmpB [Pseudobdellovibrionaceae bacterium]
MGIKIIVNNKKAFHNYHILEKYEAGLVLTGSEVKSLALGEVNLKDSYVVFKNNEAFLQKAHINVYKFSSYNNHEPERLRKLLLSRLELNKIQQTMKEKSLSCIPLKLYFSKSLIKLEIALAKGKKMHDKRADLKQKSLKREIDQHFKK